MKKAFTLIELLVVTVVVVTLMSITFKIAGVGGDAEARNKTISRLQRLENCLSGYYAAFGSYPPVNLHGSRNIYYKVNGYGIQQVEDDPDSSEELVWERVDAACKSQPVAMNFPFASGYKEYVRQVSIALTELHNNEPDSDYGKNMALSYLFDALENPEQLSSKKNKEKWTDTQLFRFGMLSFLLPRYQVMMGHSSNEIYDGFKQWYANNEKPARFDDGTPYSSWADLNRDMTMGSEKWKVALLPSQAVTARWMANLENILHTEHSVKVYGVELDSYDGWRNICVENPRPILYSASDSQGGEGTSGSQQYALDTITCYDGWYHEFYYYSPAPYQSYRLWSAGANGRTFPPWIPEEDLNKMKGNSKRTALNWIADDIVHLSH